MYTIWHANDRFIYVGMSGRSITERTAARNSPLGLYTRLASHASGRRSGDQFCVYVADRLVLQTLSQADIAAISSGEHQMDAFVRRYIHQNLRYRFQMVPDGATGYRIEAAIKNGDWGYGRPCSTPHGYDSGCAAASSSSPRRDGLSTGLRRPLARVDSVGGLLCSGL